MIGNNPFFLIGKNGVFALITRNYNFDAFFKVGLRNKLSAGTYGMKCGFVDYVGKLCAGGAGGHSCYCGEIHIGFKLDFLCVNAQNSFSAFKVGKLNGNAAVKTTGARKRRVKGFRTVGSGKNNDTVVALKAIHFGKKLVKGLFAFIVAAICAAAALLTYGVDFVYKDNARRLFLCLIEKLAHL